MLRSEGFQSEPCGHRMCKQGYRQGLKASMKISYDELRDVLRILLSEAAIGESDFEKRQTRHHDLNGLSPY